MTDFSGNLSSDRNKAITLIIGAIALQKYFAINKEGNIHRKDDFHQPLDRKMFSLVRKEFVAIATLRVEFQSLNLVQ